MMRECVSRNPAQVMPSCRHPDKPHVGSHIGLNKSGAYGAAVCMAHTQLSVSMRVCYHVD